MAEILNDASIMNYEATRAAARRYFASGIKAVFLLGPPGCGKTAMKDQLAQDMGLQHVFMLKAAHHEVTDIAGLPVPESDKRTHQYPSADMLPPSDLTGGLLFVADETGDCNIPQQNLLCQIVFENRLHNYVFPQDTYFLLTSNRVSDRSGANRIVTKLGNRCAMLTVRPTTDEWFNFGAMRGFNPTVLAFIKMHGNEFVNPSDTRGMNSPTFFNSFDPSDPLQGAKPQFSSSRSLEFLSQFMNYVDANEPGMDDGTLLGEAAGIVGTPVASKFVASRKIMHTMPDTDKICAGKPVPYPKETVILWALALTLASKATKDNLIHIHDFLDQGPVEYLAMVAKLVYTTRMPGIVGPGLNAFIRNPKLKPLFSGKLSK